MTASVVASTGSKKTVAQQGAHGRQTWVLLRGLGREAGHWDDFLEPFKEAFPDDRVLTPDLPGAGRNREATCPLTIGELTDAVRRDCAVDGPVHLFAISLGGMVALDWAQRYPNEVVGFVLVNSSVGSLSKIFERLQPPAAKKLFASMLERNRLEREKKVLDFISNFRQNDLALAQRLAKVSEARPVKRSSVIRQLLAGARFRPRDEKPKAPGLVLYSAKDQMVHPNCSRAIAAKWGFEKEEHPTAGHDLAMDDGKWVIARVVGWIDRLRNRREADV